jgi:ankyrin repeat protein
MLRTAATLAGALIPCSLAQTIDFARQVQPILSEKCYICHGPGQQMAGLRFDRRDSARPFLDRVIRRITSQDPSLRMPPWPPVLSLQPAEVAVLKLWIENGAQWPEPVGPRPAMDRLLKAIARHDLTTIKSELRVPSQVNGVDGDGATPLMHAALDGDLASVTLFLNSGADPNLQDTQGLTALILAVEDPAKVRLLLKYGAKPDLKTRQGTTALIAAALVYGSRETLTALLKSGADPNAMNLDGQTPLVQAASIGYVEGMKLLIQKGARVNAFGTSQNPQMAGLTPLTASAYYGGVDAVRLLLDKGAGVDDYDNYGLTPLSMAVAWEDRRSVEVLVQRGADVNRQVGPGNPAPMEAGTPLMLAAYSESRDPGIANLLISHGARVNVTTRDGQTAMTRALSRGRSAMVEALISAGAQIPGAMSEKLVVPKPGYPPDLRAAVEKSLALLQRSDREFMSKSGCRSCHNQALPAMAVNLARKKGFRFDAVVAQAQFSSVQASLATQKSKALQMMDPDGGSPQSGGYMLFAYNVPSDDATSAFVRNIAARQLPDGRWRPAGLRPPMENDVPTTALAVRAMQRYGTPGRDARYRRQIDRASTWLAHFEPRFTEERVFQLLAFTWTHADPQLLRKRAGELLAGQNEDGGWSQLPSLESDAYATGQTLYALEQSGFLQGTDAAYRRGVDFLLRTQAADGSWFVKTRALSLQPYLDAGFPYGKNQFVSAAGTSWAAMALMLGAQ